MEGSDYGVHVTWKQKPAFTGSSVTLMYKRSFISKAEEEQIMSHESDSFQLFCSLTKVNELNPISVAARSKSEVCGHSLIGNAGSNPAGSMDVCLL